MNRYWILSIFLPLEVVQGLVRRPSELSCDFQGNWCSWRNESNSEYGSSWILQQRVVSGLFNSIPRGVLGFGDTFASVSGQRQSEEVLLASDVITCQQTPAHLGFFIWKSSLSSTLEVCHRIPPGPKGRLDCFAKFSGYIGSEWVAVYVVVPPVLQPFEIIFKAAVIFFVDVIGVDKVIYEAEKICDPSYATLYSAVTISPTLNANLLEDWEDYLVDSSEYLIVTPPPIIPLMQPIRRDPPEPTTLHLPPLGEIAVATSSIRDSPQRERKSLAGPCIALVCDFENDLCDYETDEKLGATGKLRIICSQINAGSASIIPKQGECCLISTSTLHFRVRKVLASRSVFTYQTTELIFDYYLPVDASSRIQVCVNSILNCIWSATRPKRSLQRWWKQRIQLQPGKLQIYFVLEHMARGSFVALDDIKIVHLKNSERIGLCEMYADDGETLLLPSALERDRNNPGPIPFFQNLEWDLIGPVTSDSLDEHEYNDYHSTSDMFNFDIDFG